MISFRKWYLAWIIVVLLGSSIAATAQVKKAARPEKSEGITKDQADAILSELKQIRQLLEKQLTLAAAAPSPAPPAEDKLKMNLPSGAYMLGREDAPLTLVEFTDYQCPFCKRFHTDAFAEIKKSYIDSGKLRFISRDLPLDFHPNALNAAEAARCAGEQGKFWEMRELLMSSSANLGEEVILKSAQTVSLQMEGFRTCLSSGKYKPEIQKDIADAGQASISATPTFVLGKTSKDAVDGIRIVGAVPYAVFDSEIKKFLP